MFMRIDIDNKINRLCVVLVNYNMVENADKLVEKLKNITKYPTDIYVVDNGSDLVKQSKYTTLNLVKNVQTTNGWLMGLHYANAISINEGFEYTAYCFLITSLYINDDKDILSILMEKMLNDDKIVGIAPSLDLKSTSAHRHLYNHGRNQLRNVNFIDNLCSVYRADWFDNVGYFNPKLTYAWGIDIESGYLARKGGYKVCIDDSISINKITNIGYKMNRMNMSENERDRNARTQMYNYFKKKYGMNWVKEIYYE